MTRLAWLLLLLTCPGPAAAAAVEFFSPQGAVKSPRQVVARFSEPMVAFGDPRPPAPFAVTCRAPGRGRWADARTWVYDFDRDLPGGLRCAFELKAGVKTAGGAALSAAAFRFETGGPAVVATRPVNGSEIEETQVFVLRLDTTARADSVLASAGCEVEGLVERLPVRFAPAEARVRLLAALNGGTDSARPTAGPRITPADGADATPGHPDKTAVRPDNAGTARDEAGGELVFLQCARPLPNGARVRLVWGPGVVSASGLRGGERQVFDFRVRPAFTAELACTRVNARADCVPGLDLRLRFSAPVAWAQAAQVVLREPSGRTHASQREAGERSPFVQSLHFKGPFPAEAELRLSLPASLVDDAGRSLANAGAFPMTVRTDEAPPLAKFAGDFGILEAAHPVLPVSLRNLEPAVAGQRAFVPGRRLRVAEAEVLRWLVRLKRANGERSLFAAAPATRAFQVPRPAGAESFEVIGIPLPAKGFYAVELASPVLGRALLGRDRPYYVATGALVTDLAVHFKRGRASSLVWVTTLSTARPVAGAQVRVVNCEGRQVWAGRSDRQGIARIPVALPEPPDCPSWFDGYLVSARAGDDFSFALSGWTDGIEPWRFELPPAGPAAPLIAHTVLDRSLLRAGDTVHMKHFLRAAGPSGLRLPPARPTGLVLRHLGSDTKYELPIRWRGSGLALTKWQIPAEARLGEYEIELGPQVSGRLRIEEFRVPTMRAALQAPGAPLIAAERAPVGVQLSYLSGGGAGDAPARLRYTVGKFAARFPAFPEAAVFANGGVRAGTEPEEGYSELEGLLDDVGTEAPRPAPDAGVRTVALTLDRGGAALPVLGPLPRASEARELQLEFEFSDANGETQTVARSVPLWPAARLAGVAVDDWARARGALSFTLFVADPRGQPVADAPVRAELFGRETYSHRKRLIGGFYAYEHVTHTRALGTRALGPACAGRTDARGALACSVKPPAEGQLIVQASTRDAQGRVSVAHAEGWVAGEGEWWFQAGDTDRMDLLPEKSSYEPGDTAVLQVRAPFRAATALVTVEREGVLDAFVTELSGRDPVVRLPVTRAYAPNIYVSVLAARGRVGAPAPTALADLAKPAFKLGLAGLRVGWRAHRLDVGVSTPQAVYPTRARVPVTVTVRRADGSALPAGTEVALAAVDEGLLELAPNESWDLLAAMMRPRALEVTTATAQSRVVGKRHFGRKAQPAGGGGGRQATRALFDTLAYWHARLPLGADGRVRAEVPLTDALSGFRLVAVASGGADTFGTGAAQVRTSQDLILLSGLPPLVREGDRFRAGFTLRNGSDRALTAGVTARVTHAGDGGAAVALEPRTVALAAGQAGPVEWEFTAPAREGELRWEVTAQAGGAADRLEVTQRLAPVTPVRAVQASLLQLTQRIAVPVEKPKGALPGRGGVSVELAARLTDNLGGVAEFMRDYPYTCLEQRVSKAVALQDDGQWQAVTASLPAHLDGDGLLRYFPGDALPGSDVLTSYVLALSHEAGRELPAATRERMLTALSAFAAGRLTPAEDVPAADLSLRRLAALEALSRYGRADPALLDGLAPGGAAIQPELWPTSALLDWLNLLQRLPGVPGREQRLERAERLLRARVNFQGTALSFSTERGDALPGLMVSPDANAVRAVLSLLERPGWQDDLPRLTRGALLRQENGHWDLTTANAWGVLAMQKFGARFEAEPVTGLTTVRLGVTLRQRDWKEKPPGGAFDFPWPEARENLALEHKGRAPDAGSAPWATVTSRAALPLQIPFASGYRLRKTVTPVTQSTPGHTRRGDVLRVRLEIEAQADMRWVAVNDPIPAGATVLGGGLGRDSALLSAGTADGTGGAWPAFEERGFEAYRAYYRFLPKGKAILEYTLRVNNAGEFSLPPTRVEALYAPEIRGELPNPDWAVGP